MALDGYSWQGQCVPAANFASHLVGQSFSGGVIYACADVTSGLASIDCGMRLTDGTDSTSTVPIVACDSSVVNAGDLGVTVEITGAVLLFAIGIVAGLLS